MPEIFPDPLDLELLPDGFHYKLLRDFSVRDEFLGLLIAPAGFVTDLGSIPKIFWNIIPPNGKPSDAYVIHDLLYSEQKFTRAQCDSCLLRMMLCLGVSWYERYAIFLAVRAGGWAAWAEDAKRNNLP
jgi:hypothetical protein